jgi:hypothetical protein
MLHQHPLNHVSTIAPYLRAGTSATFLSFGVFKTGRTAFPICMMRKTEQRNIDRLISIFLWVERLVFSADIPIFHLGRREILPLG